MSLNIKVNSQYKITSDQLNVIVNRKYIVDPTKAPGWAKREAEGADPTPREDWREVAYFSNVENAAKWLMNQQIRESDAEDLSSLVGEIKRFEREIKAVLPK
jgi:hypothetical protein